jgi:hypothetical protein
VSGWSGTPGVGAASVTAVHEDGSLDLEVIIANPDPRFPATRETFLAVPHVSAAQSVNGELGPHWYVPAAVHDTWAAADPKPWTNLFPSR